MPLRRALVFLVSFGALASAGATPTQKSPSRRAVPGRSAGETLLPNGWRISPVGRHIQIGDLPLAMAESPDGKYLLVTNNGFAKPTLKLVDLARRYVRSTTTLDNAWLGLAWNAAGDRVYTSAAKENAVRELTHKNGRLKPGAVYPLALAKPVGPPIFAEPAVREQTSFVGGLALDPPGKRLFAVNVLGQTLSAVDLATGTVVASVALPAEPYTCVVSKDGATLFVSLWGGAKVLLFDPTTLAPNGEIPTGEHPNAMAFSKDGATLFVACANTNSVWAADVATRAAREQISIALEPKTPPGSTPNALGISPDGRTLLVANADNNSVAVVDVTRAGNSRVRGWIPTGWYPTGAQFSLDGKTIYVLSGKGLVSSANPRGPQPAIPPAPGQSTRDALEGTLSFVPVPDDATLAGWTARVRALTPYRDANLLAPARAPRNSPVPARVGAASPIRHVFYVIRENRTYDQILGDMKEGNGDPDLCLFGEDVTPNAHALAREFVLLDNFYVNAEVSYDGHAFSTGAYATDVVEKIWPMNYGNRGGEYLSEGGGENRNPYGNVAAPAGGYIWDACNRAGVSVRSYGEFVHDPHPATARKNPPVLGEFRASSGPYAASVPGLEGKIAPGYPPFDLSIPDNRRIEAWLEEFRQFEKDGTLPRLSIVRLGGDHTNYALAGSPTPRAMIAENDLALGRLVEEISKSRYWKESAIFVLEDDAQNGPDHVDCHRSPAFVISPWTRRGAVDSTMYTTCGMLRTMELVLGLPPMSQCDAAARPMYAAFSSQAVATPWTHKPARVSTDEKNGADEPGAAESAAVNLQEADRAPDVAFNEILWKLVRGKDAVMPPPVHAGWVRPSSAAPADDE
ncbi:MAG: bifunctional YncE family protein/alkaline phosphatase family protein [Acidobacteriota bacterium]|nr:bifunctional YncE family protein/alkaline phosphatase family protein [Acidobacteriota bacterium]